MEEELAGLASDPSDAAAAAQRERTLTLCLTSAAIHALSSTQPPALADLTQPTRDLVAAAAAAGAPSDAAALTQWLQERLAEERRRQDLQAALPESEDQFVDAEADGSQAGSSTQGGEGGTVADEAAVLEAAERAGRSAAAGGPL